MISSENKSQGSVAPQLINSEFPESSRPSPSLAWLHADMTMSSERKQTVYPLSF